MAPKLAALRIIASVLIGLIAPTAAHAAMITTSGTWNNVQGSPPFLMGNGTNVISWGATQNGAAPANPQSSYRFAGVGGVDIGPLPSNLGDAVTFDLGFFTHNNFTIFVDSITGATLNVNLGITNGSIFNGSFVFPFLHNETSNDFNGDGDVNDSGCPFGGNEPCGDVVMIDSSAPDQLFNFMSKDYQLEITGFRDNGLLVTEFLTAEGAVNTATLKGRITRVAVPEPASLPLLALGLAIMALMWRRSKSA